MGRQDSHNGPADDGVSEPAPQRPAGNAPTGRAAVPPRGPATYGSARVAPQGAVYGTLTGANPTVSPQQGSLAAQQTPPIQPPPERSGPQPAPPEHPPAQPEPQPAPTEPQAPVRPRRSRTVLVSVISVFVLLAVAAAVLVVRPGPVRGWLAGSPSSAPSVAAEVPEPAPPAVLPAAVGDGTVPTAAGVRTALASLIKDPALGARVNISVVDVAGGQTLYAANPDAKATPASTTKLVTAATVLAARGPAYRLSTRVVAGATPGEVVIIGGGDPTLGTTGNDLFPGAARLDRLAAQVKKALGGVQPTRVVIDGTLFTGPTLGPGWDSDLVSPGGQAARITALSINGGRIEPVHNLTGPDPRFTDPSKAAGQAFAKALGAPDVPVVTGKAPAPAPGPSATASAAPPSAGTGAPAGTVAPGTELGRVDSPPMVRLVDWMLQLSDNVLAEALARQVALAAGEPASFDGAARAMEAAVTALGLPAAESDLFDGSGLSRRNRMSPSMLTDLLLLAASGTRPELTAMFGGLPVAAWSGTLQTRFKAQDAGRPGQGLVRAKTGTLSGVSALSGGLVTVDGRLLVFAIMADGVPDDARDSSRVALDRIAAKLVTCGCP